MDGLSEQNHGKRVRACACFSSWREKKEERRWERFKVKKKLIDPNKKGKKGGGEEQTKSNKKRHRLT